MAASPPPEGPGHWVASVPAQVPATALATGQLAWLGDAVWELHQRLRHCRQPARAADLHLAIRPGTDLALLHGLGHLLLEMGGVDRA